MIYEVMEAKGGIAVSSDVTVKAEEVPEGFRMAPRNENSSPNPNPTPNLNPNSDHNPNPNPNPNPDPNSNSNPVPNPNPVQFGGPPVGASPVSVGGTDTGVKKKRGRPRKYAPDGTLNTTLSPMPISSSIPLTGDYSTWKRGRGRPIEAVKKQHNYEYESTGNKIAYFVGANFMPHVITVNAGEDVTMKVMSFSQQGARAICILSANGTISNVTLRQPTSSGGTLTYEGRFEILSLSGSFMPTENGGTKSRSGGMSVSLAGPDGRVLGGGLAGLLVAAGPVQVVVGSFLPGHQQESKNKKQRIESAPAVIPATINIFSPEERRGSYGGVRPVAIPSPSFHGDNPASFNPMQAFRDPISDNRSSSPDDGSKGPDHSNCEVSY
uniref:AT-hook motif nuclear-localized protein n=2 Tax=Salix TaxID=40685 RepID=A0A6N2NFV7_SALVM